MLTNHINKVTINIKNNIHKKKLLKDIKKIIENWYSIVNLSIVV